MAELASVFEAEIDYPLGLLNVKAGNLTLFHIGGGGGVDSALLQIVFFIASVRDAAEPRNLVTFPKI